MSGRRSALLNVMVAAAEKAGRALIRDFGEVEQLQVSKKGPGDFVSTADFKSEKILYETLLKARPTYGFLFEERGIVKGEDENYKWIIDPLDGTTNFLHGLPHWCISIALEKNKEIVSSVIHDPIKDETFIAERGCGAFSNSKRLRVASKESFDEALVSVDDNNELTDLFSSGTKMRNMGSTCLDLAYVAAGRLDAFCKKGTIYTWDKAAGILLIKEAGGYISEADGNRDTLYGKGIVAANTVLHPQLIKKLKSSKENENITKLAN